MMRDMPSSEKTEATEADASSSSNWSILDVLIVMASGYRFILLTTALVGVATAAISLTLAPRYTAESSLLPPQQSSLSGNILSQLSGGQGLAALAGAGFGEKSQNETYTSMFKSRAVEDAMVKRFDLTKVYKVKQLSAARYIFDKRSSATAGVKDGIIRVTVDASTPEQAAAMTNAYVEEFQKLAAGVATTEAGQRRVFYDRQLEDAKNQLADAEQDLKKTELTTGMVQPDTQSRAMIESAAGIQAQIAVKEVQMRALSSSETKDNPDMMVLDQQLGALRSQLAKYTGDTDSESELFVPKGRVPAAALDYIRKLREVKYRETIFQALATQFQLAKLDEAKQGAVFQVIDPATPPDNPSFPRRTMLVFIASMVAFLLACVFVWVRAALQALGVDPENGPKVSKLLAEFRWRRS